MSETATKLVKKLMSLKVAEDELIISIMSSLLQTDEEYQKMLTDLEKNYQNSTREELILIAMKNSNQIEE